ncbi:MAG: HK97 gp10 family phage protein [Microthrixaceae bacterium]|nr:HK97 gp10 family phage protein [Microthrixaceae bacterium]
MFRTTLRMYDRQYLAKIEREETSRMEQAVRHLRNVVVQSLGKRVDRDGKRVVGRSKPGEPPRLETGELRRSIATEVVKEGDRIVGRVGTNKVYGKYLELPGVLNRPYLAKALQEQQANINRILVGRKITA